MPPRGTEPDDVLRQAAERRRGIATQADILAEMRRMLVLGQQGDEDPQGEFSREIIGDLSVLGTVELEAPTGFPLTVVQTATGNTLVLVSPYDIGFPAVGEPQPHALNLANGMSIQFWSDEFATATLGLDGVNGNIDAAGIISAETGFAGLGTVDMSGAVHSFDEDARWEAGFHANYGTATYTTVGMAAVTTSGSLTGFNNVAQGPGVTHTTGNVSGNIAQAVSAVSWRPDWGIDAVFRIRGGADLSNIRYWVGLFASDPSGSSAPSIEYAGFRFDDSVDTTWKVRTVDSGSLLTTTDSGIAPGVSTTQTLRIFTANGSSYTFWIDGAEVATHTTHLPTTSTQLFAFVSVTTRAAETNAIRVHHVKVLSR